MAITFNSSNELKQYFYKVEAKVIEAVSKKLLEDFQKHLMETVYAPPQGEYERYGANGGFYSGWEIVTGAKDNLRDYVKTLIFNPSKLITPEADLRNGQIAHAGNATPGEDIREMMAKVLNEYVLNEHYSVDGGALYLRNGGTGYWDSYLKDWENKVDTWMSKELLKYGIKRG